MLIFFFEKKKPQKINSDLQNEFLIKNVKTKIKNKNTLLTVT